MGGRRFDLLVLAGVLGALALGLAIRPTVEGGGTVLRLAGIRLPPACWLSALTGIPCAGCGMTRAVVLALHGEPAASFRAHPFAIPLILFGVLQVVLRGASLAGWGTTWLPRAERAWIGAFTLFLAVLVAWWLARLAGAIAAISPLRRGTGRRRG